MKLFPDAGNQVEVPSLCVARRASECPRIHHEAATTVDLTHSHKQERHYSRLAH